MSHKCIADGCTKVVGDKLAMCLPHWRQVPLAFRDEVWFTYRRAPGSCQHMEALAAARDSLRPEQPVDQQERLV